MTKRPQIPDRLVLMRHAESVQNALINDRYTELDKALHDAALLTEWPNRHFPLSQHGLWQAKQAGDFVDNDPEYSEIAKSGQVFYSPFERTAQTKHAVVGGSHGSVHEHLRERDYGLFDDALWDQTDPFLSRLWNEHMQDYWGNFDGHGEGLPEVSVLARSFLSDVVGASAVMAITHGDYMRVMRHVVEGLPEPSVTPASLRNAGLDLPMWNTVIMEYEVANGALFRRVQYPQTEGKPMPKGAGVWKKV
jgi:broad specificity phosphatase PhoE